ncbi:MAG TPA: DUF58 domain-containing protein [Rhodanobacteraceae bacterium]|jgi:uncharacterized protein (DUF58 family)|nr:DUF58 domain-containing protein [Rhodanobacteraceae bacterium]
MSSAELIPSDVRARLKKLRLRARHGAGGDGLGQHASRSRGAGLEFVQYRAYEPGDEPRRIDWKLFARSDRYFVRESERDSPLTLWIVIDASASMAQCDAARPAWSKLDAAKAIAACAIELALRQGDRFGLITLAAGGPALIAADAGARHRDRCLLELERIACAGEWPAEPALRPLWERVLPSSLVLVLSDFFDDASAELALRFAAARREVLTVQMLSAEERDFPFTGGHRFLDVENGQERRVEAAAVRSNFLERFVVARKNLARRFAAGGIRHAEYFLDTAPDLPLQNFFGIVSERVRA